MAIGKYKVLLRNNVVLDSGISELNNEDNVISFENMRLELGDADPSQVILLSKDEVLKVIDEVKNTVGNLRYNQFYNDNRYIGSLPIASELNDLYNGAGIPDVNDTITGNVVALQAVSNPVSEYDSVLFHDEVTGLFEEGIFVGGEWIISELKNELPQTINDIVTAVNALGDKVGILDAKTVVTDFSADAGNTESPLSTFSGKLMSEKAAGDKFKTIDSQDAKDVDNEKRLNALENDKLDKIALDDVDFASTNNADRIVENKENAKVLEARVSNAETDIDNINNFTEEFGDKVDTNTKEIDAAKDRITDTENDIKDIKDNYQTESVPKNSNFSGPDTVEGRITDTGARLISLETEDKIHTDGIKDNKDGIAVLDDKKQNKDASTYTSEFAFTNMESRDKENFDRAATAQATADQALNEIKGIQAAGDLATYIFNADAEFTVNGTGTQVIPFDNVQTEDGNSFNDGTADVPKILGDAASGKITIENVKYPGRKWVILGHMVLRKNGNAGTADPVVHLRTNSGGVVKTLDTSTINDLDNDNDLHSYNINSIIIDGASVDYAGEDIEIYLDIEPDENDLSISQNRTFGIEEKVKGGTATVAAQTSDSVRAVNPGNEGGQTQEEINIVNKEVKTRTDGITKSASGQTEVDTVNVKELFDKLDGYVKTGGNAVIDGYEIISTFKKLLDVQVEQPDSKGAVSLGDLIDKGNLSLTSLVSGQSLIDRNDLKLKQVYKESGEDKQTYLNRLWGEVETGEAFVDGFLDDFNINWVQSKSEPTDTVEGKQAWNSIRINNNGTVDLLLKDVTKAVGADGSGDVTLVDNSTLETYSGTKTTLTDIFNEIVIRMKEVDTRIKDIELDYIAADGVVASNAAADATTKDAALETKIKGEFDKAGILTILGYEEKVLFKKGAVVWYPHLITPDPDLWIVDTNFREGDTTTQSTVQQNGKNKEHTHSFQALASGSHEVNNQFSPSYNSDRRHFMMSYGLSTSSFSIKDILANEGFSGRSKVPGPAGKHFKAVKDIIALVQISGGKQ